MVLEWRKGIVIAHLNASFNAFILFIISIKKIDGFYYYLGNEYT